MMLRLFAFVAVLCFTLPLETYADGGYEEGGGGYEHPPPKTKFNIGFNLPAMSISLPKLELPQISIKASVKNKKPFTLQMPVIKFNAHASTEEDHEYGSGGGYGGHAPAAYGEAEGGAGGYGPSAYASSPNGVSGYASSDIAEVPSYAAAAASPKLGYERPAAGQYNDASAQPAAYPSGSSYGQAGNQNAAAPNTYASAQTYNRPMPQQPQQQQHQVPQGYTLQNQGYTSQPQTFIPQHNYQSAQQIQYQPVASKPSNGLTQYQSVPTMTANGYRAPRPVQQPNQVPEYRDENIKFYGSAPLYHQPQNQMQSTGSGPLIEEFYGSRLRPTGYVRRSNRPYVEHMGGVFLASASDAESPVFLTPFDNINSIKWSPRMHK